MLGRAPRAERLSMRLSLNDPQFCSFEQLGTAKMKISSKTRLRTPVET